MAQPKSILLQITVTVNANGTFTPAIVRYFDQKTMQPKDTLYVNVGDQIAWLVQINMPNGRRSVPYSLGFTNASFFGVSSLEVPAGGTSPFLTVLSLYDLCSYTLNVTGVGCVFDPDIQSGSDSVLLGALGVGTAFHVTWDTIANTITWTSLAYPNPQPFPMQVAHGDTVDFTATAAYGSNFSDFVLTFVDSNSWLTPFEPNDLVISAKPNSAVIGPLGVNAPAPSNAGTVIFPFVANVKVNNAAVAPSASVNIIM